MNESEKRYVILWLLYKGALPERLLTASDEELENMHRFMKGVEEMELEEMR